MWLLHASAKLFYSTTVQTFVVYDVNLGEFDKTKLKTTVHFFLVSAAKLTLQNNEPFCCPLKLYTYVIFIFTNANA